MAPDAGPDSPSIWPDPTAPPSPSIGPGPVGAGPPGGYPFAAPDPGASAADPARNAPAGGFAGYGVPPAAGYYGYPVAAPKTNSLAIASMVVSISGLVLLWCYGLGGLISVAGAILGHVSRRQIRERNEGGDGMALAGIIVGWITAGLTLLLVALLVVFVVAFSIPEPDAIEVP